MTERQIQKRRFAESILAGCVEKIITTTRKDKTYVAVEVWDMAEVMMETEPKEKLPEAKQPSIQGRWKSPQAPAPAPQPEHDEANF